MTKESLHCSNTVTTGRHARRDYELAGTKLAEIFGEGDGEFNQRNKYLKDIYVNCGINMQ